MAGSPTEARPACYRCDERVDGAHRIRLSITHGGDEADRYEDVTRSVCVDCVAAIGLLEFADVDTANEASTPMRSRLAPIRTWRGGD